MASRLVPGNNREIRNSTTELTGQRPVNNGELMFSAQSVLKAEHPTMEYDML